MLEKLKEVLSNLYGQLGLTEETLALSQILDEFILQEQMKRGN